MHYFIYCPRYTLRSYGIRVLYTLAEEIHKTGQEVTCICHSDHKPGVAVPARYHSFLSYVEEDGMPSLARDDIAIYSDTIIDNPLHANRVVRYLMNKPGVLTGKLIQYSSSDYLVAYSSLISDWLPRLYLLNDDREEMCNFIAKKKDDLVLFYLGKVRKECIKNNQKQLYKIREDFSASRILTRKVPSNKKELYSLIARASLLVSLDPLTNLNYEATLLGTPVLLVDDVYCTRQTPFSNGIIYDYAEYRRDANVTTAYQNYCVALESQGRYVSSFLTEVATHFARIDQGTAGYLEMTADVIARQRQEDVRIAAWSADSVLFKNYSFPDDVPISLRTKLDGEKQTALQRDRWFLRLAGSKLAKEARRQVRRKLEHAPKLYQLVRSIQYHFRMHHKGGREIG